MESPREPCPPPSRCIENLLGAVEGGPLPEDADARKRCIAWLRDVRSSPEALEMLEDARAAGIFLPGVLAVAATIHTGPGWLKGPLGRLVFGGPFTMVDVERLKCALAAIESELGTRSAERDEVEMLRREKDRLDAEVRRGEPYSVRVPDGAGGFRDQSFRPEGSFIARTTAEIGPAAAGLEPTGSGRRGEAALTVVALLVAGHTLAVTGERRDSFVSDLLTTGLKLGYDGGAVGPKEAMRRRVIRAREENRWEAHRTRAAQIAALLGIAYRID